MMVKVCGITRREDAETAVEAGASALGFVFVSSSPRYVTPERAAELGDGLPILKVGVFENETAASVEGVMRAANLDVAQIYGGSAPKGARVWRACRMAGTTALHGADSIEIVDLVMTLEEAFDLGVDAPEAVLLDGPANGIPFDWSLARNGGAKLIIAGGLHADNVAGAIRTVKPWGVDASSRLESSPGIKDHEKVRLFVEAALKA
ncbi:MAG TPA: phosphoribosylanthranilate isomerase [Bryobacteraceae bacterium]|jgi:phosphoribosylanthranilate isomerase